MPFTAAHPAIILPFVKLRSRWLSTTGLVTGSIAPDFEYFLKLRPESEVSHSLLGILTFNLPVAFILATVFHLLVRDQVIRHLPAYFQKRALAVKRFSWLSYLRRHWLLVLVSICIGTATHIFWDGFTHPASYFVRKWPILMYQIPIFGYGFEICRIIQHVSTIFGGLVVLWYIRQAKQVPALQVPFLNKLIFWGIIPVLGVAFVVLSLFLDYTTNFIGDILITYLSGLLLATVVVSVAWEKENS